MTATHLIISTSGELLRVSSRQVIYITSDGNYSNMLLSGGEMRMVTFQLGQMEQMIKDQLQEDGKQFVRIGKSLIINLNHVYYINVAKQQLILTDAASGRYTLSASKEALKALKELIEKAINL